MKLVKAIIQPHRLDVVHEALLAAGVTAHNAKECKAFDRRMGHAEVHRGKEYAVAFMPMIEVETAVPDNELARVVETIREAAKLGSSEDGRILVSDVQGV